MGFIIYGRRSRFVPAGIPLTMARAAGRRRVYRMTVMYAIFGLFFAVGFGMSLGSYFSFRSTRRFLGTAIETQGVVAANVYETPGVRFRGDDPEFGTYHARIHFRTRDGRSITFQSKSGSSKPDYSVNQRVPVLGRQHRIGNYGRALYGAGDRVFPLAGLP